MKPMTIAISSVVILLAGYGMVCADQAQGTSAKSTEQPVKKQMFCPVMESNPVNTNLFVDADGKRIYVCCTACLPLVQKDPKKYIAKLEKEGITLDKTPAPAKKSE